MNRSPHTDKRACVLHTRDNVATALEALSPGDDVTVTGATGSRRVAVRDHIPFGHKFAIADLAHGDAVCKYGETIGCATAPIPTGAHVHVHNVASRRGRGDLTDAATEPR